MLRGLTAAMIWVALAGSCCVAVEAGQPVATPITLQSQDIKLPGPGSVYTGPGAELLNQNCALCHSPTFVNTQPALSASTWQAEVLKMKNVFGAPIDPNAVPAIVKVLMERYGTPGGPVDKAPIAAGASG